MHRLNPWAGRLLLLVCAANACGQVDFIFTGGADTNWFNLANWTVEGLPATQLPRETDNVTIGPAPVTAYVAQDVQMHDLTVVNQGAIDGPGVVRVSGTLELDNTVPFQTPVIRGTGTLYSQGHMNVRGTCSVARLLVNGISLDLLQTGGVGPAKLVCASSVVNYGTITLEDGTTITGGASLLNAAGAIIEKRAGSGTAYLGTGPSASGLNVISSSSISVSSGTLSLFPATTNLLGSALHAEPNAVLALHQNTVLDGTTTISGGGVCELDGSATVTPGVKVTGNFQLDRGGTMTGTFRDPSNANLIFVNGAHFNWTGGTLTNLVGEIQPGAVLAASGSDQKTLAYATIRNSGRIEWRDSGSIIDPFQPYVGVGSAYITNYSDLVAYNDAVLSATVVTYAGGTVSKMLSDPGDPTGLGSKETTLTIFDLQNASIQTTSGQLTLQKGHVSNSTFAVSGQATLHFGPSFGVTMNGHNSVVTGLGSELYVGSLEQISISSGASLEVSGNFRFNGERISGPGALYLTDGLFRWDGGNLVSLSNLVIDAKSVTVVTNNGGEGFLDCLVYCAGALNLGGTVDCTSTAVTCAPGSSVTCTSGTLVSGTGSSFLNQGTLTFPVGVPVTWTLPITNFGTIQVEGPLALQQDLEQRAGTVNLTPTCRIEGTIRLDGGALTVAGQNPVNGLLGNVINNSPDGGVSPGGPPGTLWVTGDYQSTSNATVTVGLGGLTGPTNYDQINIIGAATLNGSLNVHLANGFVPGPGDRFNIMSFGSRTGTFPVLNGVDVGNGVILVPEYGPTNLSLVATNPTILRPNLLFSLPGGTIVPLLSWSSVLGQPYDVQWSPDLGHWYHRAGFIGTGEPLTFLDTNPPGTFISGYYRVR